MAERPSRILLADDSMVVRAVVRGQLVGQDYELIEAADGIEALQRVHADAPDVVLLDVEMPGKTGYEVLEELQADPTTSHIPVVFLSGRVTADDVARGLKLGAHDYLRKPVEPGELIARLTAALRTKELHDRLRRDNAHLREIAPVDSLTGVIDIRGLQQLLKDLAAESKRSGAPIGGVLLDVDGLEAVNDRFGWDGGDSVLREIATRIGDALHADHVLGRCGPDELLVLMPGADAVDADAYAAELRTAAQTRPHTVGDEEIYVTVSVGAASIADGDAPTLLADLQRAIGADKARERTSPQPTPLPHRSDGDVDPTPGVAPPEDATPADAFETEPTFATPPPPPPPPGPAVADAPSEAAAPPPPPPPPPLVEAVPTMTGPDEVEPGDSIAEREPIDDPTPADDGFVGDDAEDDGEDEQSPADPGAWDPQRLLQQIREQSNN